MFLLFFAPREIVWGHSNQLLQWKEVKKYSVFCPPSSPGGKGKKVWKAKKVALYKYRVGNKSSDKERRIYMDQDTKKESKDSLK